MKKILIIFFMFFLPVTAAYALNEGEFGQGVEDTNQVTFQTECPEGTVSQTECPKSVEEPPYETAFTKAREPVECPKNVEISECPKSVEEPPYETAFLKAAESLKTATDNIWPKEEAPYRIKWRVSQFFDYQKGKFSGDNPTIFFQTILALTSYFEMGDISLSGSYVSLKSDSQVTVTKGYVVQRVRKFRKTRTSSNDFGDFLLNGTYYLVSEKNTKPLDINLYGYIKLPVADKSKGLGTGRFDEGGGFGLAKRISSRWKIFGNAYYILIGSPRYLDLNNETIFDAGAGFYFTPNADLNLIYAYSTALASEMPDPSDIILDFKWKTSATTKVYAQTGFGLSKGSPSKILKLGISLLF